MIRTDRVVLDTAGFEVLSDEVKVVQYAVQRGNLSLQVLNFLLSILRVFDIVVQLAKDCIAEGDKTGDGASD